MLKQDINQFFKSKTNWLGIGMIIGGAVTVYNAYTSNLPMPDEAIKSMLAGFALIFVRDGIAGVKNAK